MYVCNISRRMYEKIITAVASKTETGQLEQKTKGDILSTVALSVPFELPTI